jgi:hypothetical protein
MRCRPTIFLCPPPPLQSKRRHGFAARPLLVAAPALCFWSLGVWVRLGTPRLVGPPLGLPAMGLAPLGLGLRDRKPGSVSRAFDFHHGFSPLRPYLWAFLE